MYIWAYLDCTEMLLKKEYNRGLWLCITHKSPFKFAEDDIIIPTTPYQGILFAAVVFLVL